MPIASTIKTNIKACLSSTLVITALCSQAEARAVTAPIKDPLPTDPQQCEIIAANFVRELQMKNTTSCKPLGTPVNGGYTVFTTAGGTTWNATDAYNDMLSNCKSITHGLANCVITSNYSPDSGQAHYCYTISPNGIQYLIGDVRLVNGIQCGTTN